MNIYLKYSYSGKEYVVDEKGDSRVSFDILCDNSNIKVTLINNLPLNIIKFSIEFPYDFSNVKAAYLNGYQSWTHSRIYNLDEKVKKLGLLGRIVDKKYGVSNYGDYNFITYSKLYSHIYTYLINNDDTIKLFGSTNEETGFSVFRLYPEDKKIVFEKDIDHINIFGNYNLAQIKTFEGNENEVFDNFFGPKKDAKANGKLLKGYTSWYRHYQDIDEEKILNDLKGFEESNINFNIFQIDDGYQQFVGDWLKLDKRKFPNGLEKIVAKINKCGLNAGLWFAPFVAEAKSDLFKEHQDWFAKDAKGNPFRAGGNWSGFYVLDFYNQNVQDYLTQVFKHYQAMGFKLFKLDFLYAVCLPKRDDKSRGQVMNEAMDFLRLTLKNSLILGCGLPLGAAFNKVDYCRIGPDVTRDWDDKWYMKYTNNERLSTKYAIQNTIYRHHLDGRVFYNDPDVFILRNSEDVKLTKEEKLKLFNTNIKYGSVLFTSDDIALYTDEENKIFKQISNI